MTWNWGLVQLLKILPIVVVEWSGETPKNAHIAFAGATLVTFFHSVGVRIPKINWTSLNMTGHAAKELFWWERGWCNNRQWQWPQPHSWHITQQGNSAFIIKWPQRQISLLWPMNNTTQKHSLDQRHNDLNIMLRNTIMVVGISSKVINAGLAFQKHSRSATNSAAPKRAFLSA